MTLTASKAFAGQTSNARSASYVVQGGSGQEWHAFLGVLAGGFGGGACSLDVSPDGGTTWVPVQSLSAPGVFQAQIPPGLLVSFNLTGATAATLSAWFCE